MTKAEASLIMLTWIHFKCRECGAPCVGNPTDGTERWYVWCLECAAKYYGALPEDRHTLPLRIDE